MKKKELINLANKIVECETTIQTSNNKQAIYNAENEIIKLTKQLTIEDMMFVDNFIINLLEKNNKKI